MNELLHHLIHYQLSDGDRLHIRAVLSEAGKAYQKVFEYMVIVPPYDRGKMEAFFENDPDVGQLGSIMTHLYIKVMQGLWISDGLGARSTKESADQWLKDAEVLERRGAIELAHKKALTKAHQKAQKGNDAKAMFYALFHTFRMVIAYEPTKLDELVQIYQQLQQIKVPENALQDLQVIYLIAIFYEQSRVMRDDYKASVEAFLETYPHKANALSPLEKLYYHRISGLIHKNRGKIKEALDDFLKALAIASNSPSLLQNRPDQYIKLMDVAIMLAIETEDWNTVDGLLEEVSKTAVVMPRHKAIKLQLLLLVQIKRLASKPYILDKHIHEVHIHSSQINEYEPLMDKGRLLAIKYELGVLYFTNVSYFAEASYWFNQIALGHREKRRKDIQKNVRIFDVICQIEFGNITLFSSKIATLRKFIGRNLNLTSQLNAQREFDQEVMRNLRSISNQLENGKDAAKHYKQLFEIALKAYHQHSASGLYNAAEIMLWIAGKYPELRNKLPD